jgi:CHAT domain-containing protein
VLACLPQVPYAGASSAIVGLWYVADEATRVLMEGFYSAWLDMEGQAEISGTGAKATALRRAQQLVMRTGGYDHPYSWGPFILVGDWR